MDMAMSQFESPAEHKPPAVRTALAAVLTVAGLYAIQSYNFLLFHSLAEIFSIVVACAVFFISWHTRKFVRDAYLPFLGLAYLFVAAMDMVHTLAYKGLGVFPGFDANLPTQLWIAARYMESITLLVAPALVGRRLRVGPAIAPYAAAFILALLAIFVWRVFPDCYIEGHGLTVFKTTSEYVICLILALALAHLCGRRRAFHPFVFKMMAWSIVLTILAELTFTFYIGLYGLSNFIGHVLKIASFYLIYRAMIATGLQEPYAILLKDLDREHRLVKASEMRYHHLFNGMSSGVIVYEAVDQGRGFILKDVNPAAERISRVVRDQVVGRRVTEVFPAIEVFGLLDVFRRVRETGRSEKMPTARYRDDRLIHWAENFVYLLPSGEIVAVYDDVTDRVNKNQALEESEKKFRTLFNSLGDAVFIHELDGRIIDVNDEACRRLGYSREAFRTMTPLDLDSRDFSGRVVERIEKLKEAGRQLFETVHVARDGTRIPTELSSRIVEFEGRPAVLTMARDVSDREETLKVLRRSEDRYQALFSRSLECVYIHDLEGRFLEANPAALELLGYGAGDAPSLTFADLMYPDQLALGIKALEETKTLGHQKAIVELRLKRKDGGTVFVETKGALLYRDGKPYAVLGMARDVTARKLAEDELRKNEERYRTILDSIEEGYFEVDLSGRFTFLSDVFIRATGYSRDELMVMNFSDYMPEQSAGNIFHAFNRVFRTGRPVKRVPYEVIDKNGDRRQAELSAALKLDDQGQPSGFRGIAWDVTESRKVGQALRAGEEKYRHIIQTSSDGIIVIDEESAVRFVNPAAETLFGRSAEQMVGRTFGFPVVLGETTEIQIIRTGALPAVAGMRVSRTQWEGREAHLVLLSDITDRKRAEEENRQLEAQLRQSQKMEAIGAMAGGIAHDFNNLLTTVGGYAELISIDTQAGPSVQDKADVIRQQVRTAARLVRQILDFSRRSTSIQHAMDFAGFLKENHKLLSRTIPEHIKLSLEIEPGDYFLMGDPVGMQQVVANLAVNARDALPKGGEIRFKLGRLGLSASDKSPVPGMPPGDWLVFSVRDNGEGIHPKILPQIFDPFFTTKEAGHGTGLGLAQVFGIVARHQGFIEVDSDPGRGTDMRIYLRASSSPGVQAEQATEEGQAEPRGRSELILLVEDEAMVLELGKKMIESLGYRVLTAADGLEALAQYDAHAGEIALVLTDVVMPHMDGQELVEALKARNPGIRVLVWTGYASDTSGRELLSRGVLGWIIKPATREDLAKNIKAALERPMAANRDPAGGPVLEDAS